MSYSIFGPGGPREQGWQCAPFGRSCIGDIVTGPARSVVGSAPDSPALAEESGRVQPAVPGNAPSSPRGGDCQAARSGGSAVRAGRARGELGQGGGSGDRRAAEDERGGAGDRPTEFHRGPPEVVG